MDEFSERGVHNPKVIDLISFDRAENEVTLTMIETRHWGESEDQLDELQAKFNNYIDYCLDGWLTKQYPQYEGCKIKIRVQGRTIPEGEQQKYFDAMSQFCLENDLEFQIVTLEA